ncbi:hypothetical protein LTR10_014208 [Elasticomyces elasticus]|uniref:Uncharacterized protein n=1 Tax=Exophiala sideris TaxID=1016849 RepID=A0ABR0JIY9_9EURO|nr:hypothetical protein LTR10_014208 [Elasticomyces elasticus]KAK5034249.1 hypothetical protein LTS07_003169 [Exophiala sideris]KAK5065627.1 hypothetical protein LTR69_003176 [Exophiala sideris]KAK5185914.1 hypothetical protein LTR44_001963 [Eurotiomycetes sp. CCFEE 6388]
MATEIRQHVSKVNPTFSLFDHILARTLRGHWSMACLSENDDFYQGLRADFDREIEAEKSNPSVKNPLPLSIREFIDNIYSRFVKNPAQVSTYQEDFHALWYMFIRAAQNIDAESAEQDRLFNQLVYAKELGATLGGEDVSAWIYLPYLVEDFEEAWVDNSRKLSPSKRRNFAAFTARLLALGACDVNISLCALWLLRETLETTRAIGPDPYVQQLAISEILPAVVEWFHISSTKLLKLAVHEWSDGKSITDIALPGALAQAEGIQQPGFSIFRWVFWRNRLGELYYHEGADGVRANAKKAFDHMILTGRLLGHEIPGEKTYWSVVFRRLDRELQRSGKASVGLEDILPEPGWANEPESEDE